MWETKTFSELSTKELYEILYLRTKIFVVDQERVYQEVDQNDLDAIHVFNMVDGKVAAYARIFPQGNNVTFGRVVTDPKYRGQGFGKQLMEHIMQVIHQNFAQKEIEIEAQVQVQGFYQKFAFESQGQPFLFNHTPHIKMTHPAV